MILIKGYFIILKLFIEKIKTTSRTIMGWTIDIDFQHYENTPIQYIFKISPPKTESFQIKKKSDIFLNFAQNIDCGYSMRRF